MSAAEVARLKSTFHAEDTWKSSAVRSTVARADLSVREHDQIMTDLGATLCECSPETNGSTRMILAPAGMCERCGATGPRYQEAERRTLAGLPVDGLIGIPDGANGEPDPDADLDRYVTVDWLTAWERQPGNVRWLREPVIEEGTLNVIYGKWGDGKSLVTLEIAAGLAAAGRHVSYFDNENRECDHVERLQAMGHDPGVMQKFLHMYSFQAIPDMDTHRGGNTVLRLARRHHSELVVIDTTMRFVGGKENDADTFNAVYNHAMVPLKGDGIACIRLDHPGKDAERGQRGSSGKAGDVDTIWRLTWPARGRSRYLENEKSRTSHIQAGTKVRLAIESDPFRHEWHYDQEYAVASGDNPRDLSAVTTLDSLGIAWDAGRGRCRQALKEKGIAMDTNVLTSAIRTRKERGPVWNPQQTGIRQAQAG